VKISQEKYVFFLPLTNSDIKF